MESEKNLKHEGKFSKFFYESVDFRVRKFAEKIIHDLKLEERWGLTDREKALLELYIASYYAIQELDLPNVDSAASHIIVKSSRIGVKMVSFIESQERLRKEISNNLKEQAETIIEEIHANGLSDRVYIIRNAGNLVSSAYVEIRTMKKEGRSKDEITTYMEKIMAILDKRFIPIEGSLLG